MNEYYRLHVDVIGRSDYWQHISKPPNHNMPVWLFIPDMGNDDDGYGYILIGYQNYYPSLVDPNPPKWLDYLGRGVEPEPLMWAPIRKPEPPILSDTLEGARERAVEQITKRSDHAPQVPQKPRT